MLGILKTSFRYGAGLAGLSTILFLTFINQWVTSPLISNLSADQVFYAFIASLTMAVLLSMLLLMCHFVEKKRASNARVIVRSRNNSNAINNSGNGSVTINQGKKP